MQYTACFTGHRPKSLPCGSDETRPVCLKIKHQMKELIKEFIEKKSVAHFISGAALGVDMWAMEIVIELKKEYPNITLEAAVPCRSQADRWNASSKERYNRLLSQCDKIEIVSEIYTADCMMKRNKYMVDNSDYVIAVWNEKPSGTGNTVRYAAEREKAIYYIDTKTLQIKKF